MPTTLRDGVLDLQARIHFEKWNVAASSRVPYEEKLDVPALR